MEGIEKPSLILPSALMEGIEKLTLTTPSAFPELSTKIKTQYSIFEALEIIANCTDNIEKYLPIKTEGIEKPAFPLPELSAFPELSSEPELTQTTLLRKRRRVLKRRIAQIKNHGMDSVRVNLFKHFKFNNDDYIIIQD
jgi:hypothetical protein